MAVRTIRSIEAGRVARPRPGTVRMLADVFALTGEERDQFHDAAIDLDAADLVPAAPREASVPAQLPADVPGFTGRDEELSALDALVGSALTPAVVISAVSGTAGVGKTALAIRWGHRTADHFPDGQLYLNLHGYDPEQRMPAADALAHLLEALGTPAREIPLELDARAARYRTQVSGRRLLIVLDNAGDVEQVRPLLPGSPSCAVVVTSRDRMAGLVARDGAHRIDLDLLRRDDAVALLRRLAGPRVDEDPGAAAALADQCARLPLALRVAAELAIARRDVALAELATELADQRRRLNLLDAGGDPRTAVTAVFSWSVRHLSPDAARLFRLLGLHPGPDISAAAAASLAGLPPDQVHGPLTELVRASLLTEHAPDRYSFHDLLRDYATELARDVDPEPARRAALTRLLDHFVHTAHAADRLLNPRRDPMPIPLAEPAGGTAVEPLGDYQRAMDWLTVEHPVLLAALRRAAATGFDARAWQLAWSLATFLDRRGHWHDRASAWQTALPAARRLADPEAQALAHRGFAGACIGLRRFDEAQHHLQAALDLFIEAEDVAGQALTYRTMALLCSQRGRPDQALPHTEQALRLYRAAGHESGTANALNGMGWCHAELGDYRQALNYCEQGLALLRRLGDRKGEAATLDSLGYAHHHLGHRAEAVDCYRHSVDVYRELGDRYNAADSLVRLGDAHLGAGDTRAAHAAWLEALDLLTDLQHPEAGAVRARIHRMASL